MVLNPSLPSSCYLPGRHRTHLHHRNGAERTQREPNPAREYPSVNQLLKRGRQTGWGAEGTSPAGRCCRTTTMPLQGCICPGHEVESWVMVARGCPTVLAGAAHPRWGSLQPRSEDRARGTAALGCGSHAAPSGEVLRARRQPCSLREGLGVPICFGPSPGFGSGSHGAQREAGNM